MFYIKITLMIAGEEERPSAGIPSITVVQAPNVPIIVSTNPANNIPIIVPALHRLPGQRKSNKTKNKGRNKARAKKNKDRKHGGKKRRNRKKGKEGKKKKMV